MNEYMCPYINKEKAKIFGTEYYCEYDKLEFNSIIAHCKYCEIYHMLLNRIRKVLIGTE